MEHRYMSLNTYLSLQPFWDITQDQTSIRILYDDAGQKIGEIFRFSTNQETLETIPGIGMAALVLSCSPELPVAFASIRGWSITALFGLSIVVSLLSAAVPIVRTVKKSPVEAIRDNEE